MSNRFGIEAHIEVIVKPITPKISAGSKHVVGLSDVGNVFVAGNEYSYPSDFTDEGEEYYIYNPIVGVSEWEDDIVVDIIAKGDNTVALTNDGRVLACGLVWSSVINGESNADAIAGWRNVVAIYAGPFIIAAKTKDNGMYVAYADDGDAWQVANYISTWGAMDDIVIGEYHAIAVKDQETWRTVFQGTGNDLLKTSVSNLNAITDMCAGVDASALIGSAKINGEMVDGIVYVTGKYRSGTATEIRINMNAPSSGELTDATLTNATSLAISYTLNSTLGVVKANGTVQFVNLNSAGAATGIFAPTGAVAKWTDINQLAIGSNFAIGLTKSGSIRAAGQNTIGAGAVTGWQLITLDD